jgi:hypothetical protein
MVVFDQAALVNADMRLPSRKLFRIQLDFVGKEHGSLTGQSHDSTKTLVVVLLGGGVPRTQAVCQGPGRWPNLVGHLSPE